MRIRYCDYCRLAPREYHCDICKNKGRFPNNKEIVIE